MQRNLTSLMLFLTVGVAGILWIVGPTNANARDAHQALSSSTTLSFAQAVTTTETTTTTAAVTTTAEVTTTTAVTNTPAVTTTAPVTTTPATTATTAVTTTPAVTTTAPVTTSPTVTTTPATTTTAPVTATIAVTTPAAVTTTTPVTTTPAVTTTAPAAAALPSGCQELVVNGNFEARTGWRLPVTPHPGLYSAETVFEGTSSLRLGLLDKDRNVFSFSTGYQLIRLPANAKTITLKALVWRGSTDTKDRDFQYLIVDPQRGRPHRVFLAPTNAQKWEPVVYDATALKGQLVRLVFGAYNNGRASKTVMYVDSVSIQSCK